MKVLFTGELDALSEGIGYILGDLGMEIAPGGLAVEAIKGHEGLLELHKDGDRVKILYGKPVHFFRALSLLKEHASASELHLVQRQQFETCGAMYDVSQGNAVINLCNMKRILRRMALMGLDMLMVYTEDSYVLEGEPWFGYMRGKYSQQELKEIDDYAFALGIEAIPCMQTLAHLVDTLRWSRYSGIKDDDDTLMVGDERTYEFIEKMIAAASAPFRTKRIHIGMDEAWKLGQGNYLLKNGYKPKYQILTEHLKRVLQITKKYDLKPFIWCDMYFRSVTGYLYHSPDIVLPQEVIDSVPDGVTLMGWEYYQFGADTYDRYFSEHKRLSPTVAMAGGIWTFKGFVPEYDMTFLTSNYFLNSAKKVGIRTVMATVWGDCGTESNIYTTLLGLQLFAEHNYLPEEPSKALLQSRFKACTGCDYDDFYEMTYIDKYDRTLHAEGYNFTNPTKALMWQDILMGLLDRNFEDLDFDLGEYYAERKRRMDAAIGRNGEFDCIFRYMSLFCSVLELKADAGIKLRQAYLSRDDETLRQYAETLLPELIRRVGVLREYHFAQWMQTNKPFGWDVMDIRYGGLVARADTTIKRLKAYLSHEIDSIEELEQERLYYNGKQGMMDANEYTRIATPNRL